jgi:hypothetical protein
LIEYTGTVADALSALANVSLVVAAVLGFKAWKKQLTGSTEYDISRRLLKNVYRLRNAIQQVRVPMMLGFEFARPDREKDTDPRGREHADHAFAYDRRFKAVADAGADLDVDLLEAEAIWTTEAIEPHRKTFNRLVGRLTLNVRRFLVHRYELESPDAKAVDLNEVTAIVFRDSDADGTPDKFTQELDAAVLQMEKLLRPKLKS